MSDHEDDHDDHDVVLVDATGKRCPLPIIDLARAAASAPDGTWLRLLSTDPAAESDVAAWCRLQGHDLLEQNWSAGTTPARPQTPNTLVSTVRIRRTQPAPAP